MAKYVTISDSDLSRGMDSRSAENQIEPGFVLDLLNADIVEKRVRKRKGNQGYSGNVPARVSQVQYKNTANEIWFRLDTSVDLSASYSTPIVIYGRTSSSIASGGPFTNSADTAKYYAEFTIGTYKTMLALTSGTLSILNSEHSIDTTSIFAQAAESTSTLNRSHRLVDIDAFQVNETTYDMDVDYTNSTSADIKTYVYYSDKTAVTGSVYIHTISHTGSGSEQFDITAATHGLSNYNIIVRVQEDLGTERETVLPDDVLISSAGQVSVVLNSPTAKTFYAILSAPSTANTKTGTINANSTASVIITGATSPWIFLSIYLEQTPGGTKEQVLPNDIQYNDSTQEVTVQFVNGTGSALNFFIYYEYGTLRANEIFVSESTISVDATDTRPQLTIWGLDHADMYGTGTLANREGWVTHIDSYKRSGESRVVCGLGGNLFRSRTYTEDGTSYLYAQLYPRLQARIDAQYVVGPTFHATGATPARSRGYVTGGDVDSSNRAVITSVSYDAANTWTKYVLSFTSMAILDSAGVATTIGNVVSTTADLEDWLIVTQMSHSKHQGTLKIKQVTSGTNLVNIWVENSKITSTDYDDSGVSGFGQITSDRLTFLTNAPFLSGDTVTNANISGASLTATIKSSSSTSAVAIGFSSTITIPGGVVTTGTRSSSIVPLRAALPSTSASTSNLVRGDMLSYTGINRLIRTNFINPDSDRTVNITADGSYATVALTTGDTSHLRVGGKILILFAGAYSGIQTITSIPSTTTFKFATSLSTTQNSASLIGSTVEIDETFSWTDTENDANKFRVERRWIPIEAPDDSYGLTPSTYIRHLDKQNYNNMDFLRSVMVVDNMYFTNGSDEVYKFDGTNLYRAGIVEWQPSLFTSIDEGSTAKIVAENPTATITAASGNVFTVASGNEKKFPVGSRARTNSINYEILETWNDGGGGTSGYIRVRRPNTTALIGSGTLTGLSAFRYYFRLNAIDANSNIIASAITSHEDCIVELSADATIRLKLVGLPAWDVYDYDRLDVEIYRTKANLEAPFYRVATLQMDFDNTQGYVDFSDTLADVNLLDLDETSTLKRGGELGTDWGGPLRAKYITSLGNRLVLAHTTDYPQLDIQLIASGNVTDTTYAGKTWTLRKDDTASGTVTDMVNTCVYEWINGTTANVTSVSVGTDEFTVNVSGSTASIATVGDWIYLTYATANPAANSDTFTADQTTETFTAIAHGLSNGQQIRVSNSGGALPAGLDASTTYYIVSVAADTFQLSTTLGGSVVAITDNGTGTHTAALQGNDLTYSGWWQIESKTASSVVINLTGAAAVSSYPDKYVIATDPTNIPVLLGTDGNLGMRNGDSLDLFDCTRRLALAINSSMRMVDTGLTGMGTFVPWLVARSGNDVGKAGRIILRQPRVDSTTMEVLVPASFSGGGNTFTLFVNGIRQAAAVAVSASSRIYPSRVLFSYENYPEIFDSSTAILDIDSDSAVDVNSADGQQITGIIPFFGEAAFGGAQQSGVLVVFKENSIYLVDINEKIAGRDPVQRIETEGLGCTAPYSIASTKHGIMFANESGIYALRRNQSIQYIGKYMERNWVDTINLSQLSVCHGHHYGLGRAYKLSVPIGTASSPSKVYKYDHTAESEGTVGAWSVYDSHTAVGWSNLASNAFWCSTSGRVFSVRKEGSIDDFRDDSSGISFRLDTRANDFGDPGIRKQIGGILISYRVGARNTGTTVGTSVDTEQSFRTTTNPIIPIASSSTYTSQDIVTIHHETDRRKGVRFQTRIQNSTIDEDIEIAGISYLVVGLSDRGLRQAKDTSTF